MRVQIALNVSNLEESIAYYSKLFHTTPHKIKPGYANFAINQPPLKLVLIENVNSKERVNHLGVEVNQDEDLPGIIDRLDTAQLTDSKEQEAVCCYAAQNKAWSIEPDGIHWEWYTITDDDPENAPQLKEGICCASSSNANCS